jgi:hypothetical protein
MGEVYVSRYSSNGLSVRVRDVEQTGKMREWNGHFYHQSYVNICTFLFIFNV